MSLDKKELSLIVDLLKDNSRGLNVVEIAKSLGFNRLTAAKYLDVLAAAGRVEMKSFGPSKVYYLAHRVPISEMLSYSSDYILLLDEKLNMVYANDKLLEFTGIAKEQIINKKFNAFPFELDLDPPLLPHINEAIKGERPTVKATYNKGNTKHYLIIRIIPIVFDNGNKGVAIFLENITEYKKIENALREYEKKLQGSAMTPS